MGAPSKYKVIANIADTEDLGEDAANEYVRELEECLHRGNFLQFVSALKVSTDRQTVVVVYLHGSDFHPEFFNDVAKELKKFDRCIACRVGWSNRTNSPVLHQIDAPER